MTSLLMLIFHFHNLVYLQPLGEGGALFSNEGASNKVTINAALVFFYGGFYETSASYNLITIFVWYLFWKFYNNLRCYQRLKQGDEGVREGTCCIYYAYMK